MAAVENAERKNQALSIRALADEGAPGNAIKRTIIIEFGSDEAISMHFFLKATSYTERSRRCISWGMSTFRRESV